MPDGELVGIPIFKGEGIRKSCDSFLDNWYKETSKDPVIFGHKTSKKKCPVCGGEVHTMKRDTTNFYWRIKCYHRYTKERIKKSLI